MEEKGALIDELNRLDAPGDAFIIFSVVYLLYCEYAFGSAIFLTETNQLKAMVEQDPDTVIEFFSQLTMNMYKKMDEMSSTESLILPSHFSISFSDIASFVCLRIWGFWKGLNMATKRPM